MVHEISGQNMSDLSPSLSLSVTRSHALSELAGPQEIIYVRCLSESVLGYQLAVLPLVAVVGEVMRGVGRKSSHL